MSPRLPREWREWVQAPTPWALLLLVLALGYFGSYVRHSLNFRDEGGTEALLAQRLLAGERPLVDLTLGYNVLWFYPIVGLFKLFGVNFVLLRGYCFVLSTVTALTAFWAVQRAGRRPCLAFLTGALLVVVPGMTFKNYMPLLAVTNAACLLHFALAPREKRERWVWLGGVLLGLTFLIRIDVGLFVSGLWGGGLCLRALERGTPARAGFLGLLRGGGILVALVVVVHLPVYVDARARGFAQPFLQQYLNWPQSIALQLRQRFAPPPTAPALRSTSPVPPAALLPAGPVAATPAKPHAGVPNQETLRRQGFADWAGARDTEARLLILLLYLPLVSMGGLGLWAACTLWVAWRRPDDFASRERYQASVAVLLLLGAAFTTFPQYFFFRPDSPHLSEFSPGFWVAVVSSLLLLARGVRRSTLVAGFAVLLALHAGVYLWRMLPDRWTGTIAARRNRAVPFHGENGTNVIVSKREAEALGQMLTLIRQHSGAPDYLVAYPYHPTVNVLANRRTYERNVYIDNATAEPGWNTHAIARLQRFRPAVVVLSEWDINGTEASRFGNWARETKTWIQEHYIFQGNYLDLEVYTRSPAPVAP